MGIMSDFIVKDDSPPPSYPQYPSQRRIDDEDEATLYRDDDSYTSDAESIVSSASSGWFAPPATTWMGRLPVQPGDTDPRKHVLECWKFSMLPATQELVGGTTVLGVNIKEWDHIVGGVTTKAMVKNPSELSEMYQTAMTRHEAKTGRSWPVRVVRGKAQSYEQDLEKRCKKLPIQLQKAITNLLANREQSSSSSYRHRTWTVVYMEERYVHRFTRTQGTKVNRHKIRFWKNPKDFEATEYHIIIRGAETELAEGMAGYAKPGTMVNPWRDFDAREARGRARKQERLRRRTETSRRRVRSISRPRDRSRHRPFEPTFSSPRDRRQCIRNRSCDSYTSVENYSWRRRDQNTYPPPPPPPREPEFRSRPRIFNPVPMPNRPPPVPSYFPPAPTPPETFTPPPNVSRFCVPPPPPAPPADWYTPPSSFPTTTYENPFMTPRFSNPFQSAGPCPPYLPFQAPPPPPTELPSCTNACFPVPPPPPTGAGMTYPPPPPPPPRFPPSPRLKSFCQACKSTPSDCGHFPGTHCFRPIRYAMYPSTGETHPECLACRDGNSLPPRPQYFGFGAPTAYSFTNCGGGTGRPRPPPSEDLYEVEDEDNATVLEDASDDGDDDDVSVHSEENEKVEEKEDDEDTQVGEVFEAPGNEKEV